MAKKKVIQVKDIAQEGKQYTDIEVAKEYGYNLSTWEGKVSAWKKMIELNGK